LKVIAFPGAPARPGFSACKCGDEQADHDQDGDERLCRCHQNKQHEEASQQHTDRGQQLEVPRLNAPTLRSDSRAIAQTNIARDCPRRVFEIATRA